MAYVVTITFILVGIHYQTGQQYLGFTRQLTVENLPFIFRQVNAAEQKFVQLHDDTIGNDAGWNPSGRVFEFKIFDPAVKANSVVEVTAKTNLQFRIGLHPTPINLPPIRSLALNPNTNLIYLANGFSQNVTIINGETNTVVANIPLTDFAFGIGMNSETNKVYVVGQNAVIVINGLTNTVASTIPIDPSGGFQAVAVDSIHNKIYVSRLDIQQVTVIDGLTNTVVADIAAGGFPFGIAVDSGRNKIYVALVNSNSIGVIDGLTNTLVANIAVGNNPSAVSVDSEHNKIYVVNRQSNDLSIIDGETNTVVTTVPVQGLERTRAISVDSEHNKIYLTRPDADNVSVIDGLTNTLVANIAVGDRPSPLGFNPLTNRLYVTNEGSNDVNVIDGFTNSLMPVNLIICGASNIVESISFMIKCTGAPSEAAELNYSIETP